MVSQQLVLNVSAVKAYQLCPQLWHHQFVSNRVGLIEPAALTGGKLWHRFVELVRLGEGVEPVLESLNLVAANAIADLTVAGRDKVANDLRLTWDVMRQVAPHYRDQYNGAVVAVEQAISAPIGRLYDGTIVMLTGIPDAIRRVNGQLLHSQTRTLSASTPLTPYLRAAERDLHELAYAYLIGQAYPDETYFGSELQILLKAKLWSDRKCSKAGTKWHAERSRPDCDDCHYSEDGRVREQLRQPDDVMVHKLVPIAQEQVQLALRDIMMVATEMHAILQPDGPPPIQNRAADLGKFGNSLCPYFGVCSGEEQLDDDTLFKSRENRYAEVPAVPDPGPEEEEEGEDDE